MKLKLLLTLLTFLIPLQLLARTENPEIRVFDFEGTLLKTISLKNYGWTQTGDIKVADLGTDGVPEIILSASAGDKPYVKIYRLDGSLINELLIYPEAYLGGINLEIADLDQDGYKEIITGATFGGGPHVIILDSQGQVIKSFFAFDLLDKGGVNVSAGNLYGDDNLEIVVSSNAHNYVRVFDSGGKILNGFELKNSFTNGQKIATFDLGLDGLAEIITYSNASDRPYLNLYNNYGERLNSFLVFNENFSGGFNFDYQGYQLFLGAGFGGGPHLKIVDGYTNTISQFFTAEQNFLGGVMFAVYNDKIYTLAERFATAVMPESQYILIDLSEQKLKYFRDGFAIFDESISSGTDFYPTPVGQYQILSKSPLAYSYTYGLYMPFWMNFYANYGIHELPYWPSGYREGESHLGTKVSHGCVRLGLGAAEKLYNLATIGTKVYIEE